LTTTVGSRIAGLRKVRDWTQKELAARIEAERATVASWETDRKMPPPDKLVLLAATFAVSTDFLLGVTELRASNQIAPPGPVSDRPQHHSIPRHSLPLIRTNKGARDRDMSVVDLETIPLLGRIVAGIPLLSEQNVVGYVEVPAQIRRKADFALEVIGDSMKGAGIQSGDLVFLRLADKQQPIHGNIVAAMVDGEMTLKRFVKRNGSLSLMAENPAYEPIPITDKVQIQGIYVARYTESSGIVEPPPEDMTDDELITKLALRKGVDPDTLAGMLELLRKKK